ncbi:Class B acid phosphatase [Escherichia coli]|nr:Class B acid phosphatase [Escherichia coli]
MAVGFDIDDTVLFPVRASGAAKTFSPESEDYLKILCSGKNEQWLG